MLSATRGAQLTPESNDQPYPGLPEGLTEAEFIKVMRTGEDIHCEKEPNDSICKMPGRDTPTLQVMPWPTYPAMTDSDLKAVYAYLTAIPSANACNTVADGCPGFSGAAQSTPNSYAYPNAPDCLNPAPPQQLPMRGIGWQREDFSISYRSTKVVTI